MVSCYECGVRFAGVDAFRKHCSAHVCDISNQLEEFMVLHPNFDGIQETRTLLPEAMHVVTKAAILACAGAADTAIENLLLECVLDQHQDMYKLSVDDISIKISSLKSIGHEATNTLANDMDAITGVAKSCWEVNSVAATVLHFCNTISMEDALTLSVENHCYCI